MGLRQDFLIHKRKTVDSFMFVRQDIVSIDASLGNLKNSLLSIVQKVSAIENELLGLSGAVSRHSTELNIQQDNDANIILRIENSIKAIDGAVDQINSFKGRLNILGSKNVQLAQSLARYGKIMNVLLPRIKKQSINARKTSSDVRKTEKEIKKIKNLMGRNVKSSKRRENELRKTIVNQRKRIAQLNRKIESKKVIRVKSAKKTTKRKILPRKRITTIKTPKRTITKTVTPKREKIVEIIRQGSKPLI